MIKNILGEINIQGIDINFLGFLESIPSVKIERTEIQVPYGYANTWVEPKTSWEDIDIIFIEEEKRKQEALLNWINDTGLAITDYRFADPKNYKKDITFKKNKKTWIFYNCLIYAVKMEYEDPNSYTSKIILNKKNIRRKVLFEKKGFDIKHVSYKISIRIDHAALF